MTGVQTCALPICFPVTINNVEIGANEIVRTTAIAQKAMGELNQSMIETEIKKKQKMQ